MPHVSYTNNGNLYEIKPIEDTIHLEWDIESVQDIIEGVDIAEYRNKMIQSIIQGYAYALYVNGERKGFFYNTVDDEGRYYGNSIRIDSDIIGVFFMLKQMFDIYPAHKIIFMPHRDNIKYFKSMIRGDKIRAYNVNNTPVTITREVYDKYAARLRKYFWSE